MHITALNPIRNVKLNVLEQVLRKVKLFGKFSCGENVVNLLRKHMNTKIFTLFLLRT